MAEKSKEKVIKAVPVLNNKTIEELIKRMNFVDVSIDNIGSDIDNVIRAIDELDNRVSKAEVRLGID